MRGKYLKRISVFFVILILILPCLTGGIKAKAANGKVHIKANYSDNIAPKENDVFNLTYMVEGGSDTATITVDAYDYVDDSGVFDIAQAKYKITEITYMGDNEAINNEGYGVTSVFNVDNANNPYIYISIGKTANKALYANYSETKFVDPSGEIGARNPEVDKIQSGKKKNNKNKEEGTEKPMEYNTEYDNIETYSPASQSSLSNGADVKVEKYELDDKAEPKSKKKKNTADNIRGLIIKIGGIFVIGGLGIGVMYILHKKGKF